MPELYAQRLKIGVVTPSTNTTLEPDCHAVCPDGVTVHTGRIAIQNRQISGTQAYDDHVQAMRAGIQDAIARVMTCDPQHLIMGVALEAFWGGIEGSEKLQSELEAQAGVPISMGSSAMDAALKILGVKRISILTPHMPAGDEQVRSWFEQADYQIINFLGLQCASPRLIAEVTHEQMRDALTQLDDANVDAIVQVGTNMQFMRFAAAAELVVGKPVLALNSVMCWDALRRQGIADRITGFGSLLEQH